MPCGLEFVVTHVYYLCKLPLSPVICHTLGPGKANLLTVHSQNDNTLISLDTSNSRDSGANANINIASTNLTVG
jgi:hypothetical protein